MPVPKKRKIRKGETFDPEVHLERRKGKERQAWPKDASLNSMRWFEHPNPKIVGKLANDGRTFAAGPDNKMMFRDKRSHTPVPLLKRLLDLRRIRNRRN